MAAAIRAAVIIPASRFFMSKILPSGKKELRAAGVIPSADIQVKG